MAYSGARDWGEEDEEEEERRRKRGGEERWRRWRGGGEVEERERIRLYAKGGLWLRLL